MEKRKTILSKRLASVANMITRGNRVCDVGCDHGFLLIYLIENGISPGGIASDVRKGPLAAAEENVRAAKLENKIGLRLSDGLKSIKAGEAESLVLAGMGGPLILDILSDVPDVRDSFDEIIIEPQSQIQEVRAGIVSRGLASVAEDMVYEDGKFYPVIRLIPEEKLTENNRRAELKRKENLLKRLTPMLKDTGEDANEVLAEITGLYGNILPESSHPVLMEFLKHESGVLRSIVSRLDGNLHRKRLREVSRQIFINGLTMEMCE